MWTLKLLGAVRVTDSPNKRDALLRMGYTLVNEPEPMRPKAKKGKAEGEADADGEPAKP